MADKMSEKAVSDILEGNNVCRRCILRYLGCKKVEVYRSELKVDEELVSLTEATKVEDEEPAPKRVHRNCCIACLGILTNLCEDTALQLIKDAVKTSGYEFDDFILALSIPPCLLIREHIILKHLQTKFPDKYLLHGVVPSVKEVWKWVVGPVVEDEFGVAFNFQSNFDVNVCVDYSEDMQECEILLKNVNLNGRQKKQANAGHKASVERTLKLLEGSEKLQSFTWPPDPPNEPCTYGQVTFKAKPLFLAGRYNKYSRKLCQTPWLVDGEKLMETSVKELICDLLDRHIIADEVRFSASGREDVDVRTLGKGRPFVLEYVNPRCRNFKLSSVRAFQKEINSSTEDIAVRDLQVVLREDVSNLKEGEEQKTKTYSALCYSHAPLSEEQLDKLSRVKGLVISQKTPVRVLHRRPLAVRQKTIHEMSASRADGEDEHHLRLVLKTQAGTYIKEFVHGDFGRTTPNLGMLLEAETDILELDVVAVDLNWPPAIADEDT